jgi:hypothetical protein
VYPLRFYPKQYFGEKPFHQNSSCHLITAHISKSSDVQASMSAVFESITLSDFISPFLLGCFFSDLAESLS